MKFCFNDRHLSTLAALKEAGLKVDKVEKQDKKTIITVSHSIDAKSNDIAPKKKSNRKFHGGFK